MQGDYWGFSEHLENAYLVHRPVKDRFRPRGGGQWTSPDGGLGGGGRILGFPWRFSGILRWRLAPTGAIQATGLGDAAGDALGAGLAEGIGLPLTTWTFFTPSPTSPSNQQNDCNQPGDGQCIKSYPPPLV